ncbi:MAG: hypothetical protein EA421_01665 [Gemmatimonadales bacterium]|nr:MAG: hypothetical protein EA421_01665 [Gemmatimonadales bacterium]
MEEAAAETLDVALAAFLAALGVATQRFALYPKAHPLVARLGEGLQASASAAFERRGGAGLTVALAGRTLLVDDELVRTRSPHVQELADRIRGRNLAVVEILPGVTGQELCALCMALAEEGLPGNPSLDTPRDSRNVRFYPMEFDRVTMDAREESSREGSGPATLWLDLARSALGVEGSEDEEEEDPRIEDPSQVARAMGASLGDTLRARKLLSDLRRLVSGLAESADSPEAQEAGARLHALLEELEKPDLERLLRSSRSPGESERLIREASQSLGADAVLRLLRAAVPERSEGISPSLARALSKLAVHARAGAPGLGGAVDEVVREAFSQLLGGKRVEDPSPVRYAAVLDGLAHEARPEGTGRFRDRPTAAWIRTLQMAVEVGSWGPVVSEAVSGLLEEGEMERLIQILREAPSSNEVTIRLEKQIIRPEAILDLAPLDRVPNGVLEALVRGMGEAAIDPLLDALARTHSRSTRRSMLAALEGLGEPAALRALQRLDDPNWYVIRNRLALGRQVTTIPADLDLDPYLRHEDHRVRVEALSLALQVPERRVQALSEAVHDPDPRVVTRALRALPTTFPGELPDSLLPALEGLLSPGRSTEVRVLAMGALGSSSSPRAMELLVEQVTRRGLFGLRRLRRSSPPVLEGLRILASRWGKDPAVESLLRKAQRSSNESIRQSATLPSRS